MESKYLGDIYFIKDGKVLKNIATINNENMSKQSFPGFGKALKLYSDKELDNGNEEILDIYKQSLDNNITIVMTFIIIYIIILIMKEKHGRYVSFIIKRKT